MCCAVTANNEVLHVPDDGTYGLNTTLGKTPSTVHLDWKLFREKIGNSVRVSTGALFKPSLLKACALCSATTTAAFT